MQITNGNLLQQTGSLPNLEGRKLNVADCLNQTVTVTLDADSVRFGGASQDTYKPGAVPHDYSQLGIYNRYGQAQGGETVSLTFVKTLSLNYAELTIDKDGQRQTIPLDADGGAWAVMTDGTLRKVQIHIGQEQPPCPPHRPDRPHRPGRPHDGHGPERPDGSFHPEVRQMSSINSILFPNGYNVSTIKKIDPQMNTAAGAASGKLYQLGDRLPWEDRVDLKSQVAALEKSTLTTLGPIRSNDVLSGNMTAEDAVRAVWQERHSKIRIDFETGQVYTSKDFSLVPKEGQLDAIRQELRSNGMSDVLWSQYSGITTFSSTSASNYTLGELAPALETLSAAYAAQKHLLQEQFTGDELAQQLNHLEKSHRAHVDKVLDAYSEKVGGFLDKYGSSGQTEKVRQSVQALMDEYTAKYETILAGNDDPTGTADTEDAWLGDHLGYLTQSILQIGKGSGAGAKEGGGLYTLRELEVINSTATAYEQEIVNARHIGASDEGRTALDLAMIDMKQETLEKMSGISDELKQILETARGKARDAVLDAKDAYFASRREHTNPKGEKDSWFGSTDREMFAAVYQKVMATFHETGDALRAVRDGAALAKPLLSAAAAADRESAMRWRSSTMPYGYWSTFYNDSSAYAAQNGGYQQYVDDWQAFLNAIPSLARQ